MSTAPAEAPSSPAKKRSSIGPIAGAVVVIAIIAGGLWYWRNTAANAAEAAAKTTLAQTDIILVPGPTGHVEGINSMNPIDQATFAKIGDLAWLNTAQLANAQVTDEQLAVLATLPNLHTLSISESKKVSATGLAHFAGHGRLEKIFAGDTSIDDEALGKLVGLSKLNTLDISRTKVTDAGLAHLVDLPALEVLTLRGLPITDAAADSLKQMTALRLLNVAETKITPAAVKALKAANKDLSIETAADGGR